MGGWNGAIGERAGEEKRAFTASTSSSSASTSHSMGIAVRIIPVLRLLGILFVGWGTQGWTAAASTTTTTTTTSSPFAPLGHAALAVFVNDTATKNFTPDSPILNPFLRV